MAISRLQASLAAVTNDLTIAAANINFDFTLVKYEAPKEYQAFGQNLSRKRKDDAETGTIHVTARRLGALFDGICPQTPKLVKAYGTRVSEISEAVKTTNEADNTIFAAHSGVDGASIWAAATSSTAAIHVQLLACMLARIFSGPEATSAWVELVKERKKTIASQFEDGESLHFSTITAATQLDIPRSQLADWDASARAWLRTADTIKASEQRKLKDLLEKINLSVNNELQVYSSVISAWTSALASMEKLISGMPQAVNSGPTLLALGAWYLYPDILALGRETAEICLKDTLFAPGGTLTIGLAKPEDEDHNGIHWSLSLAHLRYYGHPVLARREFSRDSGRITFRQFCQAALGCLLGGWETREATLPLVAEFFVAVEGVFEHELRQDTALERHEEINEESGSLSPSPCHPEIVAYFHDTAHWLHLMADAAGACIDEDIEEHAAACRLVRKGLRRSVQFIGKSPENFPLFRLFDPRFLFPCLNGPEAQISFLRHLAESRYEAEDGMMIQYYDDGENGQLGGTEAQYATVFQRRRKSSKRKYQAPDAGEVFCHYRWLLGFTDDHTMPNGEEIVCRHADDFLMRDDILHVRTAPGIWVRYHYVFGDLKTAAIFKSETPASDVYEVPIEDLLWCLRSHLFCPPALLAHIKNWYSDVATVRTLKALSVISVIYKLLPDATIAITALEKPLHETNWAQSMYRSKADLNDYALDTMHHRGEIFDERLLSKSIAFACVAYLESGYCDIMPDHLVDVFAMSSGDSLYISMPVSMSSTWHDLG